MSGQSPTETDTKAERSDLYTLTVRQERALEVILGGGTDQEAADAAGVTRQTVNGWKLHHPALRAEMNRRRAEAAVQSEHWLGILREKALKVVESEVDQGNLNAALAVVRLLPAPKTPSSFGHSDPHKLVAAEAAGRAIQEALTFFDAGPGDVSARERELRGLLGENR